MHICPECAASFPKEGFCASDGAKLQSSADDPLIGVDVGPYKIVRLLGFGGMGRVYKGINASIGSRVAIKVLSHECATNSELIERFFSEARAVNVIRHENIVNILDLASLPDKRPFIVMEYLDGSALSDVMSANRRLPLGTFVRFITEVLEALDAAHKHSIVHRDLKPDNIFVSPQGRAKVLDFGVAKLMPEQSGRSGPTRAGSLLGTPHYMAPEQALSREIDARTDLYAVGVILFEGATGRRPFSTDSLFELLRMHVDEAPPSPRSIRPDIPAALEDVILKALAKDPNQRQQSARELIDELSRASHFLDAGAWDTFAGGDSPLRHPEPSTGASTPSGAENPELRRSQSMPTPLLNSSTPKQSSRRALLLGAAAALLLAGLGIGTALLTRSEKVPAPLAAVESDARGTELKTEVAIDLGPSEDAAVPRVAQADPKSPRIGSAPQPPAPKQQPANTVVKPSSKQAPAATPPSADEDSAPSLDLSHKQSKTPNPASFDITGFLPTATKQAQRVFPDAKLVRIDADGVLPSGKAQLQLDEDYDVVYRFQSPSHAKRPTDLPLGVEHKPSCMYYVVVSAEETTSYGLKGWKCDMGYAGAPKCSAKKVWQLAIAKGAPSSNAVASLWFAQHQGKGRWHFSIKETDISWWIADEC